MTLQPSDQITSPVDWRWMYSKDNMFSVDWCRAYDVNLKNKDLAAPAKEFVHDANVERKNIMSSVL